MNGYGHPDEAPLLEQSDPPPKRSTLLTVCPFILANEFCERLAFYGLATNMVTYLTVVMGGGSAYAAIQVSAFEGFCYLTPLLGGWMADAFWGRAKTILVFSSLYFLGMVLLTISSFFPPFAPVPGQTATMLQNVALFGSLYVVAIGTGGIKPNVSAFGADQFDTTDPQDRAEKMSFFNWFYFAINIGSLIASTVIVYIQDHVSWTLGFAIPALAMGLAVICFVAGSGKYKHEPPTESPMARCFKVVFTAIKNRRHMKQQLRNQQTYSNGMPYARLTPDDSNHGANLYAALGRTSYSDIVNDVPYWQQPGNGMVSRASYAWLDAAVSPPPTLQDGPPAMLDAAVLGGFTQKQVEEVKLVLRMMPIFLTTIVFWTIYQQMGSMFVQQGNVMESEINIYGVTIDIPSASLSVFNTLTIVLLIPVWDRIVEPFLRRIDRRPTLLQRIGWGMVPSVFAMLAAAAVEWQRLRVYRREGPHSGDDDDESTPNHVHLSILWQAPQYFLVGASEVLASIGQLEFFYDQAPDVMRSCSMALQLLSTSLGSYLAGLLVFVVKALTTAISQDWLPRDLNEGRLDLYFLLLAGLMAANLVVYAWVAGHYQYKVVEHKHAVPKLPPAAIEQVFEEPHTPSQQLPFPYRTTQSAAMGIGNTSRRTHYFYDPREESSPYGRSLAYVPPSPALPAPFR